MGRNDALGLIGVPAIGLSLAALALAFVLLPAGSPLSAEPNQLADDEREQGFMLLFDGKSLDGWDGDPDLWSVRDGAIVGASDGHDVTSNTFLIYRRPFSDFVLRLEVRLRNGNSGIQFRSRQMDGPGWVVHGYQADLSDAGERSAWGNFYEEKGRGRAMMAVQDEGWQKAKAIVRRGDWNDYEIRAEGRRVRLTLNGTVTIDTTDDASSNGVLAIQLHSGPAMRVECRSIRIKLL